MGDEDRVTIRQVYDAVIKIERHLETMNGTVRQNCTDIAVLQERQEGDKSNWDKVWLVLQPILVALITALVLRAQP